MMSCLEAHVAIIFGPALAFLYTCMVVSTYATTHECTWSSKALTVSVRLAVLVASVAASVGLCQADTTWGAIAPVAAVFMVVSVYLLYQTRVIDVVGGPVPNFGPQHLKNKVVVITGANTGIGKETATQLAQMGATVVMACRSKERAEQAMNDIRKTLSVPLESNQLIFVPLDLGDFTSIRKAVDILLSKKLNKIDIFINNAGVMMGTKTKSKNGYELMMQANHLGHFLWTQLLLPHLQKDARIVCVTSSTYAYVKDGFDFEDMFCDNQRTYTLFGQYAQTKLANILHVKELNRRYSSFQVFAVHPGIVRTDVTRNMPWYLRYPNLVFAYFVAAMQKTASEGAYCSVTCAASPSPPASGSYVVNGKEYPTLPFTKSIEDAKRLWEISEQLVGVDKK
jgi:NAD(P)-dependent dehydrogenase (short-subunit alcohol dehydrogenase family)